MECRGGVLHHPEDEDSHAHQGQQKGRTKLEYAAMKLKNDLKIKTFKTKAYYDTVNDEIRASISLRCEDQDWNDLEKMCNAFSSSEGVANMQDKEVLELLEGVLAGHHGGKVTKKRVRSINSSGHTPKQLAKKQLFEKQGGANADKSADVQMAE